MRQKPAAELVRCCISVRTGKNSKKKRKKEKGNEAKVGDGGYLVPSMRRWCWPCPTPGCILVRYLLTEGKCRLGDCQFSAVGLCGEVPRE